MQRYGMSKISSKKKVYPIIVHYTKYHELVFIHYHYFRLPTRHLKRSGRHVKLK